MVCASVGFYIRFFGTLNSRTKKTPIFSRLRNPFTNSTRQPTINTTTLPPPALLLKTMTMTRAAINCSRGMRILMPIVASSPPPLPILYPVAAIAASPAPTTQPRCFCAACRCRAVTALPPPPPLLPPSSHCCRCAAAALPAPLLPPLMPR